MRYLEIFDKHKHSLCHGPDNVVWSFPVKKKDGSWNPGKWMPKLEGHMTLSSRGYYLLDNKNLLPFLDDVIYEAEPSSEFLKDGIGILCRSVRLLHRMEWNNKMACLFACDCAERALQIYEEYYPDNKIPHYAIEIARLYIKGEATKDELHDAWETAHNTMCFVAQHQVANGAPLAAVNSAVWTTVQNLSSSQTRAAASFAADNAADAIARYTSQNKRGAKWYNDAFKKEREWQNNRLMQYLDGEV